MRMSTKGRFAVNAIIDLALREQAGPVALASISQRQEISLSYLEQLFGRMRRLGLVKSTRGPGGGYRLGRSSSQISVADIVQAVEDPLEEQSDELRSMGMSRALWLRLQTTMLEHMSGISLESLVDEQVAAGMTKSTAQPRRTLAQPVAIKLRRPTAPNSVFAFGRSFASA